MSAGMLFFILENYSSQNTALIAYGLFFIILNIVFLLILRSKLTQNRFCAVCEQFWAGSRNRLEKILSPLAAISSQTFLRLAIYSLIIQFTEIITAYLLFKSMRVQTPFHIVLFFMPLAFLLSNLPISIFGLGVRETSVLFLFSPYGTKEALLGLGMLLSLTELVIPVLIGFFSLRIFIGRIFLKNKSAYVKSG